VTKAVLAALAAVLLSSAVLSSCNSGDDLLRAKVIENRAELVGGPVAMADIGDFLLENDQVRVAILRAIDSPGPGVFGGSVVDIDRRRSRIEFQAGHGLDRFSETFPVANLMVPEPSEVDVRVLKDGSDGQEASIRVEGQGEFLFEALAVLRTQQPVLDGIFPNIRTRLRFTTDYILRPGARHIHVKTTIHLPDEQPSSTCPSLDDCNAACDDGLAEGPDGCLLCECSDVIALEQYEGSESVFGNILGDPPSEPDAVQKAGVIAGDFVFFGNQNDVFAPGPGFDEDAATQRAFRSGRNTFQNPLTYNYVAAAGGDISYGYFNVPQPGIDAPVVNVPLFASAATAFVIAGKNCLHDSSDDDTCDRQRAYSYDRYIAVGDGDVASVLEEMYAVRGTPTGELTGHVYWFDTAEPVKNARLFVLTDPDPGRDWTSVEALVTSNLEATGEPGVINAIDADLGLDKVEDGDFRGVLPAGNYVVVARNPEATATSEPIEVQVVAGQATVITPTLPSPAKVVFRVTDDVGQAIPCKLSFVSLDANGDALEGTGLRRTYFGEGRLSDGVRHIHWSAHGSGEVEVEPGRYDIVVSRGIEYGIHIERNVVLAPRGSLDVDAALSREIDTTGWMSADMHLHSTPSFDSGMPIPARVKTVAAEGLELAVSTDHDVNSDYMPAIRELGLEPFVAHAVGAEITTLEHGHFIGFPLQYDAHTVPTHGAHDWSCQPGGEILDGIREIGDEFEPFTIVAHPRDGFFGYLDQLGVDPYRFDRELSLLEADNPVFRTASCDFDAMELIHNKRFDLVRTPTVAEVVDYNRCLARIDAANDEDDLSAACPELGSGPLRECHEGELFFQCQDRNRDELAWALTKRIITRTPSEQSSEWSWPGTAADTQDLCRVSDLGDDPIPADNHDLPCNFRAGEVDDYFRLIERGMLRAQIASSDSHGSLLEPGFPRTYFKSETDVPSSLELVRAVDSLRAHTVFTTYGPFIRATIDGKTFGETTTGSAGSQIPMALNIQTASWFGVDRVEIYLNGLIAEVLTPNAGPDAIQDVLTEVALTLPDRDSWVVIIAMGLQDENLMAPVSLSRPFGEVQLANIAAGAFSLLPVISALFPPDPTVPDWSPTPPYAVTNPIYIDVDGNGRYDAPLPPPEFCSRPCDTPGEQGVCPSGQECLDPELVCGVSITGRECNRRVALDHGGAG